MEKVNAETSWNKKKIFIAIFLLALLMIGGYFIKTRFLVDPLRQIESVKGTSVRKITSEPEIKINIKEALREKINNLKQEVSDLNVLEISSSSPQIQKVLNDIKSLEQYPTNQVKEICRKICGL